MQYRLSVEKIDPQDIYTKTQVLFINKLKSLIDQTNPITSLSGFNSVIRDIVIFAKKQYRIQIITPLYDKYLRLVEEKHELTQKTIWGGISYQTEPVHNTVTKKRLIIKQYGVLGLEIHEKKEEQLEIIEGVCLILQIHSNTSIKIALAKRGDKFSFPPQISHGILALTKTVIEETSINNPEDFRYILKASQIM